MKLSRHGTIVDPQESGGGKMAPVAGILPGDVKGFYYNFLRNKRWIDPLTDHDNDGSGKEEKETTTMMMMPGSALGMEREDRGKISIMSLGIGTRTGDQIPKLNYEETPLFFTILSCHVHLMANCTPLKFSLENKYNGLQMAVKRDYEAFHQVTAR
mmetsp:Transcript_32177/g.37242  ORF Transcript_32177/g.37242 Transcript_32177/m.37242 type:complete len:156 (+) Transcript_32177:2-469(+)